MKREIAMAWHGVSFYAEMVAKGQLPALSDVFARMTATEAPKPTAANLAGQLDMLAKQYGIPVRPMSPEAHAALQKLSVRMDG